MPVIAFATTKNRMKELETKISKILEEHFNIVGIQSKVMVNEISSEILTQVKSHNKKNLENLLEFCKLVEKEEKGLLFIRNMISTIIE